MVRTGLGVLRAPLPAVGAALLQTLGWGFQLAAIYVAMRAFGIHESLPAAALVLALMNVATIFPLWPGNVGLVQAAVALPLVSYGVAKARGFAFGIGLQAIDVAVGVGLGLIALGREGVTFAMLKRMPGPGEEAEDERPGRGGHGSRSRDTCARSRARLASRARSRPSRRPARWPPASARRGRRWTSARSRTAAKGLRRSLRARSAGRGKRRRSPIRSAARRCSLAGASRRDGGRGVGRGGRARLSFGNAIHCEPRAEGLAS